MFYIACTPSPLLQEGVEPPTKFSKGGLDRVSIFRGGCWERGVWLLSGGDAGFTQKINLNLKYFTTKNIFFSVITKNLNWEILTNWLILKDGMRLRMKNFNIVVVHWEMGGGFTKNQYIARNCLKRGLGQTADLRGGLGKKGVVGWIMHTVWIPLTGPWKPELFDRL